MLLPFINENKKGSCPNHQKQQIPLWLQITQNTKIHAHPSRKKTIWRVCTTLELQSPVATSQHQSLLLKSSKTTCTQTIRLWKDITTMSHYRQLSVSVEASPHIRFLQWFQRVRPTALSCPHVNDNALCCRHWFTSSNSLLKHINGTCFAFVPQQPIHSVLPPDSWGFAIGYATSYTQPTFRHRNWTPPAKPHTFWIENSK